MNHASSPDDTIRIQINDIYAYLFSLNRKPNHSDMEQQQIRVMERLIADNITRKDISAYSLQQIVELPVAEAERIFGPKLEEFQILNRIRDAVTKKCALRWI